VLPPSALFMVDSFPLVFKNKQLICLSQEKVASKNVDEMEEDPLKTER
jgi:hypothetical protein